MVAVVDSSAFDGYRVNSLMATSMEVSALLGDAAEYGELLPDLVDPDDASVLGLPDDAEAMRLSEQKVKELAREKFEWLTERAALTWHMGHSTGSNPPPIPKNSSKALLKSPEDAMRQEEGHCLNWTDNISGLLQDSGSYKSAARYLAVCERYSLRPNGGALLGFSLGLDSIEVDGTLTNLDLVPLCAALLDAPFLSNLRLCNQPLQDTGAAVLALALPGCPWLKELDLVKCRMTGRGIKAIADVIPSSGVERIFLRGNLLRQNSPQANAALSDVVARVPHLTLLDLQSTGLSSAGMRIIKKAMVDRVTRGFEPCAVNFEGNFALVEILNSVSHGACALVTLEAWRQFNHLVVRLCNLESRIAVISFMGSMLMMFLGSTLYHSTFAVTDLVWFFKVLDHCAIYVLIAGTYTPVLVLGCRDVKTMAIPHGVVIVCVLYWLVVFFGIIMEHVFSPRKPNWYPKFILVMYLVMGFGGVPYFYWCPQVKEASVLPWVEAGGFTYVVGIFFFLLDRRYPAMHVVWHLFVGLGAAFHFTAVWNMTASVISRKHEACANKNNFM